MRPRVERLKLGVWPTETLAVAASQGLCLLGIVVTGLLVVTVPSKTFENYGTLAQHILQMLLTNLDGGGVICAGSATWWRATHSSAGGARYDPLLNLPSFQTNIAGLGPGSQQAS